MIRGQVGPGEEGAGPAGGFQLSFPAPSGRRTEAEVMTGGTRIFSSRWKTGKRSENLPLPRSREGNEKPNQKPSPSSYDGGKAGK